MAWDARFGTSQYVAMGPFVNSSNGVAASTALTGQVIYIGKYLNTTASTYAARASTVAILESTAVLGNIWVPLTSADVDTYGPSRLITTSSGTFLPVWTDLNVISQEEWDRKYSTARITVGGFSTGSFTTATPTTAVYNALSSQVGVQSSFSTGNFTTGYRDAVQGNATGSISTATLSTAVLDAISSQVSAQSTYSTGNFTTGWRDAVQSLINGAITTATPTTQVFDLIVTAMNAGSSQSTGNFTTGLFDRALVAGSLTSGVATTGFYAAHSRTWEVDGMNLAELLSVIAASAAGESSGFESGSTAATLFAVEGSTTARLVVEGTPAGRRAVITLPQG